MCAQCLYFVCMNTTTLNLRIDAKLKKEASKLAESLGLSLSTMIKSLLRKVVREKKVEIELEPTPYLEKILRESEKERAEGYVSPPFGSAADAIAWLDDPNAKYENGRPVREKGSRNTGKD